MLARKSSVNLNYLFVAPHHLWGNVGRYIGILEARI